ncbi:hypothetical protein [uncultured Paenibacillus sp.]|uniref:hypothetical protein n=1 Tax=uncultured Paenibacillus sp. TaxID=227322 RepID=UPI0015AFE1A4|nr:hypothetical protein [uncultured Paenibacillus sp.]
MINVKLTEDFALTTDGTQFIVKERKLVDPTLAPNWKARVAADPTLSPTPRETWVDAGYYGLTPSGLVAALNSARMRAASRGNAETLEQFIAELTAQTDSIVVALQAGGLRDFRVELAS